MMGCVNSRFGSTDIGWRCVDGKNGRGFTVYLQVQGEGEGVGLGVILERVKTPAGIRIAKSTIKIIHFDFQKGDLGSTVGG